MKWFTVRVHGCDTVYLTQALSPDKAKLKLISKGFLTKMCVCLGALSKHDLEQYERMNYVIL